MELYLYQIENKKITLNWDVFLSQNYSSTDFVHEAEKNYKPDALHSISNH